MGKDKAEASAAFDFAYSELNTMLSEFKSIGAEALEKIKNESDSTAVVLFGRSYNSFAEEANLGIPQKFVSRNITIIPHDFLPSESLESFNHMYWGMGNQILKSARLVKDSDNLFAAYITNFSCGPDSIIINYFRSIMGLKPSLTLELDSHSADAGINTRIEAFLDIIQRFKELKKQGFVNEENQSFTPLKISDNFEIIDSSNRRYSLYDDDVKMIIPNMGRYAADAFAAAFKYIGINSEPVPVATYETLKTGRGNTTCKECLPLILNTGSLLNYYHNRKNPNEKTLYFMASGTGPCRFGQYHVYLQELIKKNKLENIAVFTLSDENSYGDLGNDFVARGWAAITTADVFQNIKLAVKALAKNPQSALNILDREWHKILFKIESAPLKEVYRQLEKSALRISEIEKIKSLDEAVKVVLTGEIYVRQDDFSRLELIEKLSAENIVVKVAPIGEYVSYSNYLAKRNIDLNPTGIKQYLYFNLRDTFQLLIERNIKKSLAKSGFIDYELISIKKMIKRARHLVRPELEGETILTVGSSLMEIIDNASGVISLGPFGCMPSRVSESILSSEMNIDGKTAAESKIKNYRSINIENLPFLAVETDGNIFPQIIQSKIEIFLLQAKRLDEILKTSNYKGRKKYRDAFLDALYELYGRKHIPRYRKIPDYGKIITETD